MLQSSKKMTVLIVILIFILLLTYCIVSLRMIDQMHGDARLINYLGIVRGTSQRLVKLEVAGQQNNALIERIDSIVEEFLTGQGENQLPMIDDSILWNRIHRLDDEWLILKVQIYATRNGASTEELLKASEAFFEFADATVANAELFSSQKVGTLKSLLLFLCVIIVFSGIYVSLMWYKTHRRMELLAFTDELTGLYSANYFRVQSAKLLTGNKGIPYAVVYLDINMFGYINNIFGFAKGNEVLNLTGRVLEQSLKKDEIVSRFVNDNFMLLIHYRDNESLIEHFETVFEQIRTDIMDEIGDYKISFSVGVYHVSDANEDINKIITYANTARKKVKGKHGNVFGFYGKDIHAQLLNKQQIETIMYNALKNHEFIVYFQPKFDLKTRQAAGAEALVRWRTLGGKIISPAQFIPIFEQNGFVTQIDFTIFEQVCTVMQKWLLEGKEPLPVSVNFSRLHLYDTNLPGKIKKIIQDYQIPPRYIEIEITESAAFNNLENFMLIMEELHDIGFKLEIDDFGTGYSSLQLLRELPIDGLKIDKSIVDHIDSNQRSRIIITKVIEMAKELDIQTTAEGVEFMAQADVLESIRCDLGQGYLFSEPISVQEYEKLAFG